MNRTLAGEHLLMPQFDASAIVEEIMRPRPVTMDQVPIVNPMQDALPRHIRYAAQLHADGLPMMPHQPIHAGRSAVIVGTGPSLDRAETLKRIERLARKGAVVFGLKSAAALLHRRGIRVDYSVSVDAQPNQVEKTPIVPGVTYLVASCCHPDLFVHLLNARAKIWLFHSACGAIDPETGAPEAALYASMFADAWIAEGGLTVANRAIAVAWRFGCRHVHLAGCAFGVRGSRLEQDADFYAEGVAGGLIPGAVMFTDHGALDGRPWVTQASMKESARHVAQLVRAGYVTVIGDSLAKSIVRNWDRLSQRRAA